MYIDQLFALNFAADFILLHIACGFSCERKNKFTVLAALFGGVYGACMYIPVVSYLYNPFFKMISATFMVFIAARPRSISAFLRSELTFSAVAAMFGGGVLGVLLMLGYGFGEIANNSISVFDGPSVLLLAVFCGFVFLGKIAYTVLIHGAGVKNKIVKVFIFACGRKISVNGIVDTGCTLRNPSGQEPVIIVNYRYVRDIVESTEKVCIIPYSTINGSGSFLGFHPDYVKIDNKKFKNVVIAVRYGNNHENKMYSAIINSDIFKEETSVA